MEKRQLRLKRYLFWKRVFDIVGASLVILILTPLLLFIVLAIKLTSRGPVVFSQERIGEDGKEFMVHKFRSMVCGAEKLKEGLRHLDDTDGPIFKIKDDPRVTGIGKYLRRHSFDELPQLFNVLKGDMSLVGPRPPLPEEVREYTSHQRQRLSVIPGLTCLWQVSGRSDISFYEWIELDIYYIEHRSFLLDFKILIRTIPVVIVGHGGY